MSFQLVNDFNYFIWVAFDAFIKWYLQEIMLGNRTILLSYYLL